MTSLDDLTLLQWFVSGDATLEANQSLRIQPANNLRQLMSRRGSLLATAYDAALPPRIEVRPNTDYTGVLHQILLDHHFIPTGQGKERQVIDYAHYPIPDGYRIVYGPSRQLWKLWWSHASRLRDRQLQFDLFVLVKQQWYPVREIAINSGTLYIDTLRGETVHHGDDMMVWLEKDDQGEAEKTCFWTPPVALPKPATAPAPTSMAAAQATVDPNLAPLVYALDGKVYVQTARGVVIVEGQNLAASLAVPITSESPYPNADSHSKQTAHAGKTHLTR
ncbi:hypothetical protein [Nodosilinea sp. E11]|uniref:hypothetical protein n=1 Tax=Nodosilinea sp. E11 TaxID=3037479 RepID=UPI00293458DA|nr:hypothetical protein [Nodosilinea sp. E11]WOD40556.1 hypothetical protein RRF56_07090 [Nodosilinea sp. E11]